MASSCTYDVPKYWSTSLCDQNCGVQSADTRTQHTDRQQVKTEVLKNLSNDIFYFKTVIIDGPTKSIHYIYSRTPLYSTSNVVLEYEYFISIV